MTIEQEINEAVKKLQKCGTLFKDNRQRVAALGGSYAAAAGEAAAPKGKKIHKRYSTAKITGKIRAPKGLGTVRATYFPGNLSRSINVLKFRRAKTKVYVGGKLAKNAKGFFQGKRTDAYYMGFTENGTPFYSGAQWFSKAWERSKGRVFGIMKQEFERLGRNFEAQNAIR